MNRSHILLASLLAVGAPVFAEAQVSPVRACANGMPQTEMNICGARVAGDVERRLERVWVRVRADIPRSRRDALEDAQEAWLRYREAECRFQGSQFAGGSGQPFVLSACYADLAIARIRALEHVLEYETE